jgi:general secretion pathway protein I
MTNRQSAVHQQTVTMRGFTLIEILVALIIFAVLSVTLLVRLGENIRNEQSLESKTLAGIVAENTLAQMRIKEDWSAVRSRTDTVNMIGQNWNIKTTVTDTKNENLRQVVVQVGPDNGNSSDEVFVYSLTSYIGRY